MRTSLLSRLGTGGFLCLSLWLASCGIPAVNMPLQSTHSVAVGRTTHGIITAIRGTVVESGQIPINAGLKGVLTAIQETMPTASINVTEFVVQRSDGTTVAIAARSDADADYERPTGSFSIGDQVQIVDGVRPALLRGN